MEHITTIVISFGAAFLSSFLWTLYISSIGKGTALRAASYDTALMGLGGVITMTYVLGGWMVFVPSIVGTFLGTYVSVRMIND